MRPSKFSGAQIVDALRQAEAGTPAVHVCRTLGITQTTFYRWRKRYGGVAAGDAHEVRALRDENEKLRRIVANLLLKQEGQVDSRGRK